MKLAMGALRFSAVLLLLSAPACDSVTLTLEPDAGGSAGHDAGTTTGAAGSGTTSGAAGTTGEAGTHGGGAGSGGGAGKSGGAGTGGGCICTADYSPVCGSDGHTYSNACSAGCAGVAVAHQGVCTDAGVDAATDGPTGHCDESADCIYRQNRTTCSCDGMCVATTDPAPAPPKAICNIACPAIAFQCACVNHQCTQASANFSR